MVAYADRYGNQYALAKMELKKAIESKYMPIIIFDVNLAIKLREIYKNAFLIFVGPKDSEEIRGRLVSRGDKSDDIKRRIALVDEEISLRNNFDLDFFTPCNVPDMLSKICEQLALRMV